MLVEQTAHQFGLELFRPAWADSITIGSLNVTTIAGNNHAALNRTDTVHGEILVDVELEVADIDASGCAGRDNIFLFVAGQVFKPRAHGALQ